MAKLPEFFNSTRKDISKSSTSTKFNVNYKMSFDQGKELIFPMNGNFHVPEEGNRFYSHYLKGSWEKRLYYWPGSRVLTLIDFEINLSG